MKFGPHIIIQAQKNKEMIPFNMNFITTNK